MYQAYRSPSNREETQGIRAEHFDSIAARLDGPVAAGAVEAR